MFKYRIFILKYNVKEVSKNKNEQFAYQDWIFSFIELLKVFE